MELINDEKMRCDMFREIIERCPEKEKSEICSQLQLNNLDTGHKQVLRMLLLLFFANEDEAPSDDEALADDEAPAEDGRTAERNRDPANSDIRELANQLLGEILPISATSDSYMDLKNDLQNDGSNVIFSEYFENAFRDKPRSYIYRDSFTNAMRELGNNDTIQTRLDKLKREFRVTIDAWSTEQEATNEDPLLKHQLTVCSANKLQEYCEKLLRIINDALKPQTYYMTQLGIESLIKSGHTQIILTGAPGTGKTRMAKKIAEQIGSSLPWENGNNREAKYEFVQFHPSYDYTDFVEGLRPIQVNNQITFGKIDGIFKRFCRWVAYQNEIDGETNEKKYFFIIDEINRADLSKVFGELMYCLESDKRGKKNSIKTQYQNLEPHFDENYLEEKIGDDSETFKHIFKDGFYIPKNIVVIGTMNDIDRSVESMDYALRRRFIWKEIEVNKIFLNSAFRSMYQGKAEFDLEELAKRIMKLNEKLEKSKYGLNKQYYISQGQFPDTAPEGKDLDEFIEEAWDNKIKLLIAEYVRGEDDVDDFLNECEKALKGNT